MSELTVHVSKTINAAIETVFDAWLNAETLSQFMLPMPGMPKPRTENDARTGGEFAIYMQVGEDIIPHTGQYLEIDRPNRLVFTWNSPFSADDSTVTLLFTQKSHHQTHIELTHVKFPDEESRNNHEGGWAEILTVLADLFAKE